MVEMKELEPAIRTMMAKAFIDNLPDEMKNVIMAQSIENVFVDLCSSYKTKDEIKNQLHESLKVYIVEYVADPEVQTRLKQIARDAVDTMFGAVLNSMKSELQRSMKSEYCNFLKE